MVNIDLLVRNELNEVFNTGEEELLFTRLAPWGIVRLRENLYDRIDEVALNELEQRSLLIKSNPHNEVIRFPERIIRTHFIFSSSKAERFINQVSRV